MGLGLDSSIAVVLIVVGAAASFNVQRFLLLDANTGELFVGPVGSTSAGRKSIAWSHGHPGLRAHSVMPKGKGVGMDLLDWLEEASARVASGMYVAEPLVPLDADTVGLSAFPRSGPKLSRAANGCEWHMREARIAALRFDIFCWRRLTPGPVGLSPAT